MEVVMVTPKLNYHRLQCSTVVQDMTGNDLATYLQKTYIIVHKINETRQTGTVFCI